MTIEIFFMGLLALAACACGGAAVCRNRILTRCCGVVSAVLFRNGRPLRGGRFHLCWSAL
jgi:hypothetical protein